MSLPTSPANAPSPWQNQLFGGRTAWSSTVTVSGKNVAARYWYDGQYINNAKEDAAEYALKQLLDQPRMPTVYPGQVYPHGVGQPGGY
ncbi:hypothetical protein N7454_006571 [Penicillium verhagenii]|nr:hypothetical protein N7454_006571 [Penicillium verhagenii]